MYARTLGLTGLLALAGCQDFEPIVEGLCGNNIVEPLANEYCDGDPGVVCGAGEAGDQCRTLRCGAPGTNEACRFVCMSDRGCPPGWQCGIDRVCRAASGGFDVRTVAPMVGTALHTGDVDGDGYDDVVVLASTTVSVGFGEHFAPLSRQNTTPITAVESDASIAYLDPDGRADLVIPTVLGVQLFRGSETQRLLPVTIPFVQEESDAQVRVLPVVASQGAEAHQLVLARDGATFDLEVYGHPTTLAPEVATASVSRPLLGRLAIADVVGSTVAVGEMVLAGRGDRQVQLVRVDCDDDTEGACRIDLVQTIPITGGASIGAGGTWIADLDGDGRTELIATVSLRGQMNRPQSGIVVATRATDGSFGPLERRPDLDAVSRCTNCGMALSGEPVLDHVVDLDGDGRADFVNRSGLFLSSSGDLTVPTLYNNPPWRGATVTDLNGDGLLDVAAIQPNAIDILLAYAPGLYNPLSAPTVTGPTDVIAGDFDGDLSTDLAILEGRDTVAVLFSGRQAVPTERVVMAKLDGVAGIARARLGDDAIDDLVITVRPPQSETDLLVQLIGGSSRRMASVLSRGPGRPSVAAGRFTGGAALDLAMVDPVRMTGPSSLRLVSWDGEVGASTVRDEQTPLEGPCMIPPGGFLSAAAHDLDGDGRDELLVHQLYGPTNGMLMERGYGLFVYRFTDDGMTCDAPRIMRTTVTPTSMLVGDIDGDGAVDVIVTLDPRQAMSAMAGPPDDPASLAVRWGRGDGFEDSVDTFVIDAVPRGTIDVAFVDADGDAAREIAYAGPLGLRYFDFVDRGTMQEVQVDVFAGDVTSVAGADVDGDGVGDVIVATGEEVFLYRGRVCAPGLAAEGACGQQ